jgi:Zn-dependent protease with chaperone function
MQLKQHSFSTRVIAALLMCLMTAPASLLAVTHGPELPNPGQVGMTREQQEQLGLKAAAQVYKQMPVLPDSSPVAQYVQELGRKLERVIPQQYTWPYQFHVVQQRDINAFALPGGPIFVNLGTILAAKSEAQLAGVMAHEMSHVYMQHSVKALHKQGVTQGMAGIAGAILGAVIGGPAGALANAGAQYAGGFLSLKYSREDEAQADAVGAIILWKAGYNPKALAEFFQQLETETGAGGPQFLSDHPNPGNRVAAVEKEIQDWPAKTYQDNSQGFVEAKQQAEDVKAYTAQEIANGAKQGLWAQQNRKTGAVPPQLANISSNEGDEGDAPNADVTNVSYSQVRPSGSFKTLQQNGLSIAYPDNWRTYTGSTGGVTIAPSSGVGQKAIAYGAIVDLFQDQSATTLTQATQNLVRSLQQSNPNLKALSSPSKTTVNGMPARSVDLSGTSPVQRNGQAQPERDWLVAVPGPQSGLIYVVFVAPESDFNQLKPTFSHMLDSLQLQ